ncbi:hypothetical protein D3H65_00440 [Paraflavitalea soli]|uniref:Uncharacterized protein n=1 Tax=Paraflavitalea soli TaxID=2315862 RepID=A0A3B7MDX2_9BACT|nr:right-handed parallel beta-helix repeat-containing protein [Paraflavitalea soli]AXY72538.1 hypothetical protein D3H65_00440 [Paraflavitalea soli]
MRKKNPTFPVKAMRHPVRFLLPLIVGLLMSMGVVAATFPVTNTNDAGPGSLRQAILDVNAAGAGPHNIVFNVYGQVTILSSLPAITKAGVTIDGQNKITINSNGTDQIINPFDIRANNITVRNFTLTNNGDINVIVRANTTGVVVEGISSSSTTGNLLNTLVYVDGASTNLTLRNLRSTDLQGCGGTYYGRGILFIGGMQTNLVIDSINLNTQGNTRGCEGISFRDAAINGLTLTNTNISGFQNGIILDNTGGPVETANNILLRNVTLDSLTTGVSLGFYSDFVNTNIQIKNTVIDLNTIGADDDGDYPIRFDNTTNGVTIDTVRLNESDIYFIWFNGAASNISINHAVMENTIPGLYGGSQFIRFESTAGNVNIRNTILNGDKPGNADDADYGLFFIGNTTDITLDSLTINEFDIDGIYVAGANTNFQLTNSTFTNNFDGIEFYNNVARSNVDIVSSTFKGMAGGRSGIVANVANAVSDIDLTGDTVYNSVNHGIWLYGGSAVTDVGITGCVVHDNGGAGIYIDQPDKVLISQNSVYNNTGAGIDLFNAGNCGYEGANRPVLVSSTALGAGQYQLVISLPAIVPAGYTVDIYANDPATSATSGQYFVTSLTGLNSGNNTRTVTYNTGPGATGAGFWTATLRIPANNCGTSEFSDKLYISTQGPGNVDANVKLWLRADAGLTNNTTAPATEGQVVNRWTNFSQGGAPDGGTSTGTVTYKKAGINFNPAGYFSGAAMQAAGNGATWLNSPNVTSFAVFNKYTTAADGSRVYVVYDNASGGYDYNTNGESIIFGRNGANIQTHRNGWENPVVPGALGRSGLFTSLTNASAHAMYYNGASLGTAAYNKGSFNAEQWFVGGGYNAGWCCTTTADIAEVVTFDRELTVAEIDRVHAYLAIKYGISLPGNYIASDGTTIHWNAAANAGYLKHITGIGRDDSTFLYQKQSLSADTGMVTLALGSTIAEDNASNAATIGTNRSFLVFGDNGAAATYTTAVTAAFANQRTARVWKVQKTNWTDQNITIKVNGAGASNYLLISTDPSFATISQELVLSGTGTITINSSLLANGVYFSIGASIKGPGNVTAGVALWLRADDGSSTGAQWGDFSGRGNGAAQNETARQATVLPVGLNFNPMLKFDGINDYLTAPSLFTSTGTNNIQVYAIAATDNIQNQDLFAELVSNGQHVHAHVPWSDGQVYWDAPYGYRAQGAWGGTVGAPYLWSFLRSPSTMSVNRNRIVVGTYTAAMNNIPGSNNPFYVGGITPTTQAFNGKIAELIVYNNSAATSATQRQQIESYLALKYGLTIPADYLASDGTTKYWDATANAAYSKHITGIGRDSLSALLQKQSISADTGYITMALGSAIVASNAANAGSISNDRSFFVTGDNGAAKTYAVTVTGLAGVNVALARTWKVQKTNWTDQSITISTDTGLAAPQFIIISTDATFGAGDLVLPLTNRSITLNTGQLPNGAYFTFANGLKAPGNVTAGIAAWWRADFDAAAARWSDYSGNGKTLTQLNVAQQPELLPVNINYQPALKFGTVDVMSTASLFGTASIDNIAVFAVTAADGAGSQGTGSGLFAEYVSNGERVAAWAPYGNGHVYFYPPLNWAVNTTALPTPPVAYANPRYNLFGFTKNPSQLNIYLNNTNVGTTNGTFTGITGTNQGFSLGVFHFADYFNGRIAEFVVYNNSAAMTAADRLKIQSYLALKYGITMSPAAPVNYLASDGTTNMWTAADNTGYGKRITGIGRDDSSTLYQKQSVSMDTGVVAIAVGSTVAVSNAANTGTINTNKSFLVFSDNGASTRYETSVNGLTGVNNRMTRIFKVDKTNWADQNITLKVYGGNAQTYLLVSADASFGAGDAAYVMNAEGAVTLNTSNLPDGVYFTFATDIKGPNGVNKGINFWLRADDGNTSGAAWKDYAGYGHQALQAVVAGQPVTDAKAINFNYGLKFDGTDDFLDINTTRLHPDSSTIFVAASGLSFAGIRDLVSSGAVAAANGAEFRVSPAGNLAFLEADGSSISSVAGLSTYLTSRPYIFSGTQSNLANGAKLYQNFKFDNQATVSLSPATANFVSIGSRINAGRGLYWWGNISEVIVYNRVLTDAERQSVDSYLGLKYGITLNNGATNYLASNNTVYWTADATYKSRITGIGRDDSTTLNTKQSLSADTGFVTLALGTGVPLTNETNSNTITNNKSFLVFGDNGLSAANFTVTVAGSAHNVTRRMARVWKVQKTNWVDQTITFNIKPIGIDNYLLISSDPTFATFSQEIPVGADGTISFSSALFTGTDIYYTFGGPLKSPGGVPGHAMWVRADIGTSSTVNNTAINEWNDLSAFANNVKQTTAANQPTFLNNTTNNINFNPVVRFNGSTTGMLAASILKTGTYNGAATFVVNSQATALNALVWTENVGTGTQFSLHATWSDNVVYWDPPYISNRLTYNAGDVNNQSILWTATSDISLAANRQSIFKNGLNVSNGNNNTLYTGNNSAFQLGWNAGAYNYNGRIAEVIIYTNALTPVQQQQVNTYMALKYGITLNNGNTSYLATNGTTTVWNAAANAGYKKNIAGIGRDDEEALQQKQSRSINTGLQVTIGLGSIDSTNTANPNNFTADRSYLIWGDDSAAVTFRTATGSANANYRMARIWKLQETGTVGNVRVAVPANALANPNKSYLVVSNDNVFDATDEYILLTPLVINGINSLGATKDFNTGQYFTFATDLKVPGGVAAPALWVRADFGTSSTVDGTAINEWDDFGADINHATQLTAASQPLYRDNGTNNINFNPILSFNGTSQRMILDGTRLPVGTSARTVLALTANATLANRDVISWGDPAATGNGTRYAMELGGGQRSLEISNSRYGNTGGNTILPGITSFTNAAGSTNAANQIRVNGTGVTNSLLTVGNQPINTLSLPAAYLGDNVLGGGGWYYSGLMGDVIVYDKALTAVEHQQVETYLGIKYGITLNAGTTDYLATDGTTKVWDAAANATYKNNIAGIGRDDLEGLQQKQSRSINTGVQPAIGLGSLDSTNRANTNTFTVDRAYLVWGDDNGATTFKTVMTGNANVNYRMTRLWRVQETGTVGQVEVAFPYDALPNPRQSYLVVSADATIDNADTYIPLYDITLNGKKHWAAKVDLATGQYFTVAAFIKSPGGVGATSLWVRADRGIQNNTDGTPVDVWVDYGNEVNNARQVSAAIQPVYQNNATDNINYNPVVKFNGTSHVMDLDITKLPTGLAPRTLIGVGSVNNITTNHYIIGYGAVGINLGNGLLSQASGVANYMGYSNDVTSAAGFWQLNVPNEMFGTYAGNNGQVNLYSKMAAAATPITKPWNTGATAAKLGNGAWSTAEYWSGPISEVIVFDRVLSNTERQRVSTYLAIKNGYTIDQTTANNNYLNTNSTVIWDATANAAYKNNIAGIGRDDIEGLDQRQSKSINNGAILAIGLGTIATDNLANTNAFGSDTSYLLWGSNSTALTLSNTDLPAVFSQRLTQEWKTSISHFNNQLTPVMMEFNLTGVTHNGTTAADFTLLIDNDGDGNFTTGTVQQIPATSYAGNKVVFNSVSTLTNGAVFTVAIGPQSLRLSIKAVLQGAWNGTAMRTDLKAASVLPATDPYGQGTTPSVAPNAATAAVVDWVLVELRDNANPATVVASRAAFLLANGNIVDTNYLQPVAFANVPDAGYRVAVRHRNHLGIMSMNTADFSSGVATIDFSAAATVTYGTNARKDLGGGVWGLWAGNVDGDPSIRHSAKPSDASGVVSAVLTHAGNTTADPAYTGFINAYSPFDVNLDGKVYYTAAPSDRAIIVNNVNTHPANVFKLAAFVIMQQLP